MKKLIYAADDEENIRDILKSFLEGANFDVKVFPTGDELYEEFLVAPCDLVVLDIMMPGSDGLTICKQIREISKVPIIILTAKESEMDYVSGITFGGDDYLVKPFRPSILVLRIQALFRRIEMERGLQEEVLAYGDLEYSSKLHAGLCNGKDLGLTMNELALLKYMMQHSERAISRNELLKEIWGIDSEIETRVTDETIRRIRKKIKAAGSKVAITALWGYGYKLEETP
ncbi:MAG: response regulator transcription factor [Tissierellia bacterium]|nr:response regulator transcription factor [Tissierellia bacterium]